MVFKKLFGHSGEKTEIELDTDDLIVLERYAEAEERLKGRLKLSPNDLHAHLKLAEVYTFTKQMEKAIEQYSFAADEYADDGFYEKGIALLAKAMKLAPEDKTVPQRIEKLEQMKRLDHARQMAIEGLLQGKNANGAGNSLLDAQQIWLDLASTSLVKRLAGEQLKKLFAAVVVTKMSRGTVLVEKGGQREEAFLISRGSIEALANAGSGTTTLRAFGPGDIIGESALLERKPWATTYRAAADSTLLALPRAGLEQALLGNPDPRGFLDILREQHRDREIGGLLEKLRP